VYLLSIVNICYQLIDIHHKLALRMNLGLFWKVANWWGLGLIYTYFDEIWLFTEKAFHFYDFVLWLYRQGWTKGVEKRSGVLSVLRVFNSIIKDGVLSWDGWQGWKKSAIEWVGQEDVHTSGPRPWILQILWYHYISWSLLLTSMLVTFSSSVMLKAMYRL
jgi:hypothetical protein